MTEAIFKAVATIGEALKAVAEKDRQQVFDGVKVLLGLDLRVTAPANWSSPGPGNGGTSSSTPRLSLVEYLKRTGATTNAQAILTFAMYRQEVESIEFFCRQDLVAYFSKARLPSPKKNFGREFDKVIREGWIHEEGPNSYVTQSGASTVQMGFLGKSKSRSTKPRSRRKVNS